MVLCGSWPPIKNKSYQGDINIRELIFDIEVYSEKIPSI